MAYTKSQQKIIDLLADGQPHSWREIREALGVNYNDPCGRRDSNGSLQMQVSMIRKFLRPKGEDIVCTYFRHRRCYQHVLLKVPSNPVL